MNDCGIVVIGRNEGERLQSCLRALRASNTRIVYVDSGSTDSSVAFARGIGVEVVELDTSIPFSAARARNEGMEKLLTQWPDTPFVQFVDGDVILDSDWIPKAIAYLSDHLDAAVVCGRLREEFRDASVYNRLLDLEWNVPAGDVKSCGGIALMRTSLFRSVGGFNATVIAAEEDELCLRMRELGYRIVRLPDEMGKHDGRMTHFTQWWTRTKRSGYAYAQGFFLHGRSSEKHFLRQLTSAFVWGFILPTVVIIVSFVSPFASLMLLLLYPLLLVKIYLRKRREMVGSADAFSYAFFVALAKFPQWLGIVQFVVRTIFGVRHKIIEYKTPIMLPATDKQ